MGKGQGKGADGPCCREGGSCGGTVGEPGSCCYATATSNGCASKSLQSVTLGLSIFFFFWPGIAFLIIGLVLLGVGFTGLAVGSILNFLAKIIMIVGIAAGMCCCTDAGCCGMIGSAATLIVGVVLSFIAVISTAVTHANFADECNEVLAEHCATNPEAICTAGQCQLWEEALDGFFTVFYVGAIIPMILGVITAVFNFMHSKDITSAGGGGGGGGGKNVV